MFLSDTDFHNLAASAERERAQTRTSLDGKMQTAHGYLKAASRLNTSQPPRVFLFLTLFKSYPDDPGSVCQSLSSWPLPLLTITTAQVLKCPT